jgi:hypothetical protein
MLTADELTFLKKQEGAGTISLHTVPPYTPDTPHTATSTTPALTFNILETNMNTTTGYVYTHLYPDTSTIHTPTHTSNHTQKPYHTTPPQPPNNPPNLHILDPHRQNQQNNYSLTIARPKLDFPPFLGDEPVNWLRQCEKYFALANVPIDTWVPLATLHFYGVAQTWWRSLWTPTNFIQ